MKKLLSAISTFALVIMIPALFVAYLYNSGKIPAQQTNGTNTKTETAKASQETSFKPGLMFIIKGI